MASTLVATPEPNNEPPRIRLDLTWDGETTVSILREDPDNRSRPIREAEPAELTGGTWLGYDYESWFGQSTTYEAIGDLAGTSIYSAPVSLDANVVWLRHPGIPSLSTPVTITGEPEETYALNRAKFQPLGREYPVVVTDGTRRAKAATMALVTETLAEARALRDITQDGSVLLLDVPPSWEWGIDHQYMSIGDLQAVRVAPKPAPIQYRAWTLPYDVVDRPAGGLQAQWTIADVTATYATVADVRDSYATILDLIADKRVGS